MTLTAALDDSLANIANPSPVAVSKVRRVEIRANQCEPWREEELHAVATNLGISPDIVQLLFIRGLRTVEKIEQFLSPSLRDHLPSPAGIKNIDAATELLIKAIESNQRISLYCDYDVDGTTAAAQLLLFLRGCGADVACFVPNRFHEGYGVAVSAVEKLAEAGTEILVTIDCGISNHQAISRARELGVKTVILDHHIPSSLPDADVIVNPAQQGCSFGDYRMCAAGLVWMVIVQLRAALREVNLLRAEQELTLIDPLLDPKELLDLVAMGTVCDMVPLVEINRLLVQRGIEQLQKTSRPGLKALLEVAGINSSRGITATDIGFGLGPRINAAGRLGDATMVIDLLTTESGEKAKRLASKMNDMNKQRRSIEAEVQEWCVKHIQQQPNWQNQPAFALFREDFHVGVVGIVAQRLVKTFKRPVAVLGAAPNVSKKDVVRGSIRSCGGFNIAAALQSLKTNMLSAGGHAEAGGVSLRESEVQSFCAEFVQLAGEHFAVNGAGQVEVVDLELPLHRIALTFAKDLERLQPFGLGNPSPRFLSRRLEVDSVRSLSGGHARVRLIDAHTTVEAVAWNSLGAEELQRGNEIDVIYSVGVNSYRGLRAVQLELHDFWASNDFGITNVPC